MRQGDWAFGRRKCNVAEPDAGAGGGDCGLTLRNNPFNYVITNHALERVTALFSQIFNLGTHILNI